MYLTTITARIYNHDHALKPGESACYYLTNDVMLVTSAERFLNTLGHRLGSPEQFEIQFYDSPPPDDLLGPRCLHGVCGIDDDDGFYYTFFASEDLPGEGSHDVWFCETGLLGALGRVPDEIYVVLKPL